MDCDPEPVLSEAEEDLLVYTGEPGNWRRYHLKGLWDQAQEPADPA
jgi:hypothetical protein